MRLKKIAIAGVKGRNFTFDLKPITIVSGQNAAGKTAVMDSIRILLTGENHRATKVIRIEGTIEDDAKELTLVREWKQRGKKVEAEHQVPEGFEDAPRVLLDPRSYLGKTERERAKYIAGLVTIGEGSEMSGHEICEKLAAITFEETTKENVTALNEIVHELREEDEERHENSVPTPDWLDGLLKRWPATVKAAKDAVKQLTSFSTGQARLQVADNLSPTKNVDAELAQANSFLGGLVEQLKRCFQDAKGHLGDFNEVAGRTVDTARVCRLMESQEASLNERLNTFRETAMAEADFKSLETAVKENVAHRASNTERLSNLRSSVAELEKKQRAQESLKTLFQTRSDVLANLERQSSGLAESVKTLESEVAKPVEDRPNRTKECSDARSRAVESFHLTKHLLERLQSDREKTVTMIVKEMRYECPCCLNTGNSCNGAASRIAHMRDTLKAIYEQIEVATKNCELVKNDLDAATKELDKAEAEAQAGMKERNIRTANVASLNTGKLKLEQLDALRKEVADLKSRMDEGANVDAALSFAREKIKEVSDALAQIELLETKYQQQSGKAQLVIEYEAALKAIAQGKALLGDIMKAQVSVVSLTDMQKRHAAAQQEEFRRDQANESLRVAEGKAQAVEAIGDKLREIQAELITRTFGGLLEVINQCTHGLIAEPISYHDGEIGRFVGGLWVPHGEFSGFEQAVTYMGVSAALAKDSPVRAVLIDDLIISPRNKYAFVTRAMALVKAGVVDQVFITDVETREFREFLDHHKNIVGVADI